MRFSVGKLSVCCVALCLWSLPASADPAVPANCNAAFTACFIGENVLYQLPFLAISGDVVVLEPDLTTVSDVFRIFNNLVDTGGGTGLGDLAFLYSSDDSTPLPAPSTFSVNAVSILEDPSGVTLYIGNGTSYFLATPEPSTFALLGLGLSVGGLARRWMRV